MVETILIVGTTWSIICVVFLWANYRLHQYINITPNGDRRGVVTQILVETEDEQKVTN